MCDFPIPFSGNPEVLVERASKAISSIGGTFTGDTSSGQFFLSTPIGKIIGSYVVEGQALNIHIEEKPFFLSCGQIEEQLKKALTGG
jgi:hypothetical protein